MSIEAMKQALEALESATPKYTRQRADQKTLGGALDYWKLEQHQRLKAITSLRQAIAEAEKQEPDEDVTEIVFEAWWMRSGQFLRSGGGEYEKTFAYHAWIAALSVPVQQEPKREWVWLTPDEITALKHNGKRYISSQDFARAVEALSKEKNT